MGVICDLFLVKVTKRAAAFWMRFKRLIWSCGRPKRRELPMSSREVTKLCAICSVAWGSKYFLILSMFLMWKEAERTTLETWFFRDIDESKITPRLRALAASDMSESPIVICGTWTFDSCCLEPKRTNSVLYKMLYRSEEDTLNSKPSL